MRLNPPTSGFASGAVLISAAAWGLYWIPLRYLEATGVDGAWAVALVNAPAALLLAVAAAWRWESYRAMTGSVLAIGLFTGAGFALYALGLVYSSVVRATLLFYLTPAWATLIGIVWLGEKATWRRWAAIAGGLAGLVLLVARGGGTVPLNIGDLFAFLSGVFWAVGAALIMRSGGVPVAGMGMVQFTVTTGIALLLGGLVDGFAVPVSAVLLAALPTSVAVALFGMLPAVCILFWAQKFLFPGRVGLLMMSEVLVAVFTASLLLPDERLGLLEWGGAILIVGACFLEIAPARSGSVRETE